MGTQPLCIQSAKFCAIIRSLQHVGNIIMNKLFLSSLIVIACTGCATKSQSYTESGQLAHFLNCSGTIRSWDMCYKAAGEICGKVGYVILKKYEDRRQLTNMFASSDTLSYNKDTIVERNLTITCK